MIWARLICVGIVAVVAAFVRWIPGFIVQQEIAMLLAGASLPLAVAALMTLAFSFFRTERQDGRLLISRNNTFMRVASVLMEPGQKVTVCSLFWATAGLVMIASVLLTMVSFFGYGIYKVIIGDVPHHEPITFKDVVMMGGVFAAGVVACCGVIMKDKAPTKRQKRFGWAIIAAGVVLLLANAFFLGPLLGIAEENKISIFSALPSYWELFKKNAPEILVGIGILIAFVGAVIGIIFGLFRGIKSLRTSLIGRILGEGWRAFKSRTCPIVSVIEEEQKPTEKPSP